MVCQNKAGLKSSGAKQAGKIPAQIFQIAVADNNGNHKPEADEKNCLKRLAGIYHSEGVMTKYCVIYRYRDYKLVVYYFNPSFQFLMTLTNFDKK